MKEYISAEHTKKICSEAYPSDAPRQQETKGCTHQSDGSWNPTYNKQPLSAEVRRALLISTRLFKTLYSDLEKNKNNIDNYNQFSDILQF